MGCDIHMYVEYANKERNLKAKENGEKEYWMPFGGRINPGRNYIMFGYLADVRYETPHALSPKGLPDEETLGYKSSYDAFMYIEEENGVHGENSCTLEQAKRWGGRIIERNGKPWKTEQPDWHSHSWLTTKEFAKVIQLYKKDKNNWGNPTEYEAILAAMKALEKSGFFEARVVFWFDN